MQIWPAIDLRGGRCVRLAQGDYDRETVYGDNPVEVANRFESAGARYLHLVDLDAARTGKSSNLEKVASVVASTNLTCELGGGVRDDASIEHLFSLGLTRLVVGTAAIENPDWFRNACRKWPERLVLGIDARDGFVATDGWTETSTTPATELAISFVDEPLAAIVYTDIATDGMLSGPNVTALQEMRAVVRVPVVASGGVTTVDDIRALASAGADACIVGRALYEGTLSIEAALEAAR